VDGDVQSVVITKLMSFTNYSFLVSVCNSVDCINSSASSGVTDMSGRWTYCTNVIITGTVISFVQWEGIKKRCDLGPRNRRISEAVQVASAMWIGRLRDKRPLGQKATGQKATDKRPPDRRPLGQRATHHCHSSLSSGFVWDQTQILDPPLVAFANFLLKFVLPARLCTHIILISVLHVCVSFLD